MTNASVAALYRYPVKGLSAEPLSRVRLERGHTLPGDRRFAVENGPSGFDPAAPHYLPKSRFLMLMRNAPLASLATRFDDDSGMLSVRRDGAEVLHVDLGTAEGRHVLERFLAATFPAELRGTPRVLEAPGHSFSDVAKKVVSIINLASVAQLEALVGRRVHPLRFRANLYLEGWPAWDEFSRLGTVLAIGDARLKIVKRIVRCAAVNVDPESAQRDLSLPDTMMREFGHADCGVYAEVVTGGEIATGDAITTV